MVVNKYLQRVSPLLQELPSTAVTKGLGKFGPAASVHAHLLLCDKTWRFCLRVQVDSLSRAVDFDLRVNFRVWHACTWARM